MTDTPHVLELATRETDRLEVVLLWGRRSGRVWVRVTDRLTGKVGRVDAAPDRALDVFNHPFAYTHAA